jgi:23S rRNA (cytosine1962-C5)-methyltransferase
MSEMTDDKLTMFRNRLAKVLRHTGKRAKRLGVSCYRLYDHDLPEFPFCIEFYENKLYIAEYKRRHGMEDEEHEKWLEESMHIICTELGVSAENAFLKLRQRKPGRLGQYQKTGQERVEFEVLENGLRFIVNLSEYLDTGLFLDHRTTRQWVREQSGGKRVLNLFAYTGSFSVYAAAGGASTVDTVDLSNTYLSWSKRNMLLNGFQENERYRFSQADVLRYLETIPEGSFDLVIMDPPTFSNSKKMDDFLDIQRDHVKLIQRCLSALSPDGVLFFSTNYRKFELDTGNIPATGIRDITRATTPFDFEGKFTRHCYLISR